MRKLKTFFRTLVLSSISPAYYNDVVRAPAWFSWQYFIGFQFFSAIIATITFGFALSHINITQIQQNLLAIYPQNLELSLKDGKLSINKPLPYYIPYPEGTNEPNGSSSRFIAFQKDQYVPTLDDVRAEDAVAVLTETTAYLNSKNGELRVVQYPNKDELFSLTDTMINQTMNRFFNHDFIAKKYYAVVLAVISLVFIFPALCIFSLIGLFFYTIATWIITKIFMAQKKLSFGKLLLVSFHSVTPVVLISTSMRFAGYQDIPNILAFILYLVWTLIGLRQVKPVQIISKKK
ncbi:MAG: DUF1189 family protein [Patescibacteria group bacterium]